MTAPLTFGPFRVEPRRVMRGAAPVSMIRVDRHDGSEWNTIALVETADLMFLLPALREGWTRSIELARRGGTA